MFTNTEFLTKERCRSLKYSGIQGIFVSLDSYIEEEHNFLRKRKIFSKAIRRIENAKKENIPVAISSYLTKERVEKNYIEHFMNLGNLLMFKKSLFLMQFQ